MEQPALLEMRNITKEFPGVKALDGVSLTVRPGTVHALMGENGAGKSTFLKMICGELEPTKGTVTIPEKTRLSVLKQDHFAYDAYTVLDTIIMGNERLYQIMKEKDALYEKEDFSEEDGIKASELEGEFAELNGWKAESDASKLVQGLGLNESVLYEPMSGLKESEKVKVLLAQALFGDPEIILLDEPTNDLDVTTLSILEDYLQSFPGPIITVSHDRFFLDKMADTILEVRPEGRVDIFTGNWSDWARKRRPAEEKKPEKSEKTEKPQPERPREKKLKFSYNEQREFETIDAVLAELEEKLAACRRAQEACGSDYVRLQELTDEQERLSAELDEKTERWVYLNDLKEKIDAQNSQG